MKTVKRWGVGVHRHVLPAALIMGAVLVIVSAAAYAAEAPANQDPPTRQVRVFDPFALRTVVVSGVSADTTGESVRTLSRPNMRPSIRVPSRPPCRSTFRPGYNWANEGK